MTKRFSLLFFGLAALSGMAQEADPAIPPLVAKKALQWMQNADPAKRAAAYRTFQLYGDEGGGIYRRILGQARALHAEKLSRILADERSNPFAGLDTLAETLKSERERIYKLIKTDYQKDPGKIAMLQREVASLAKTHERTQRIAAKDATDLERSIIPVSTALAEVLREIEIIDGKKPDPVDPDKALQDSYEGTVYLKTKATVARLKKEATALESARRDNEACEWANPSQIKFTETLNGFRALFGLTPLNLEERLSQAALDHSRDMASMGFFAHQSPVPGKTSPSDRARKAGFKHRWTGENIFMGSASPLAAYNAWFGSDGHRFIMFAQGPNLIGIGPHGKHWTMMTGRK